MKDAEDNVTEITKVEKEKDLGVIFQENMNFNMHINDKVKKANRNVGLIFKTFTFMNIKMFLTLYKSIVRPHLEYASVIWTPYLKKDKIAIENVQRRATRMVMDLTSLPYHERLKILGLPTLEYRRLRADMIQVYKILNGIDLANKDKLFTMNAYHATRGNTQKLFKKRARTEIRKNVFGYRVVDTWNGLPSSVITAPSVNSFKSKLNKHWLGYSCKFSASFYL